MARFWTASTIYHFTPLILILSIGGLGNLTSAYDGLTRYFARDLSQDPASLAFKMYALIWLPLAGTLSLGFALYAASERTLGFPGSPGFTRDHWKYHWIFPAVAVVIGSISARHNIWWSDFVTLEHRTANNIARTMKFHALMHTNVALTNLTQLSASTNPEYLIYLSKAFVKYGRYAGFERSIHEKYTFVAPGFSNRRGEVVLVSSMPYPTRDGSYERMLIFRAGLDNQEYFAESLEESRVDRIFREAARSLPTNRPPSPLKVKGMPLHVRMAELTGVGAQWAAEMSLALVAVVILGLWKLLKSVIG